uniref:Guanylate cyclase domain-containing protein n=1 Tax=Plectus sambesii TaxID=2011161 RepID=A0A914ULE4_9BILA
MELYVGKLESKMEDRAAGLKELNHRTKSILDSFIPNSIATILQAGRQAPPELYKNATVCYLRYCFIGRQTNSTTPNVPTAEEHMTLFETFESLAVTNPLGVKIITLTDKSVLLMSGHDGKASHADAALSTVKFSLLIANSLRGRTTQVNIGISSGAVCGFLAGSQGQRFIVLGDTVDRAKELSSYAPPSTVRLSSTTYGLVRALLQHNKIDVVLETHGSHEVWSI